MHETAITSKDEEAVKQVRRQLLGGMALAVLALVVLLGALYFTGIFDPAIDELSKAGAWLQDHPEALRTDGQA